MNGISCIHEMWQVVKTIRFGAIPKEAVDKAKLCFSDFIGVFSAASSREEARQLYRALGGRRIVDDLENLAFYLGGAARLLDLDDGHRFAMGHPGVAIDSTALACAFLTPDTSGRTAVEALVRGYEVYCYLGRIINPAAYLQRGFDSTAICGAAGAATVAGTMLGLKDEQIEHAIKIAMSMCGGLNQYSLDGGAPKYLCAGWAAKLGVNSARLASHGLEGPENILEGRLGYINAFSPCPNRDRLMLRQPNWEILNVYLKRYACVRRIHPTLDVVESLCLEHGLSEDRIREIRVFGGDFVFEAGFYEPNNVVKAQTCIPYAVSVLLNFGEVSSDLVDNSLSDPKVAAVSHKVRVILDPAFQELSKREPSLWSASRVELETEDGAIYTGGENFALGDPESPFPVSTMRDKFVRLTGMCGRDAVDAEALWSLVSACDEGDLAALKAGLLPIFS